ncbi:6676_t:CDS:2 [Gigaspora rosea]|nr:6676_t:CDS:2 [Gigaspora rosea]
MNKKLKSAVRLRQAKEACKNFYRDGLNSGSIATSNNALLMRQKKYRSEGWCDVCGKDGQSSARLYYYIYCCKFDSLLKRSISLFMVWSSGCNFDV